METVARLVVVALVVLPLVLLVVRRNPAAPGHARNTANDEPALPTDADARRQLTDLAALPPRGDRQGVGDGLEPPSRFSAEIASWTA